MTRGNGRSPEADQPSPNSPWPSQIVRAFTALAVMDKNEVERRAPAARHRITDLFDRSRVHFFGWAARASMVPVLPEGGRRSLLKMMITYPAALLALIGVWGGLALVFVLWFCWYLIQGSDGD